MSEDDVVPALAPIQFLLILTGLRGTEGKRRQFQIAVLRRIRVKLKCAAFELLAELARARFETHTGYLRLSPQDDPQLFCLSVHRLRSQINDHTAPGEGMRWVTTGLGGEYKLALEANDIAVDASFKELPSQLLSTDLRDFLIEHCPEVDIG